MSPLQECPSTKRKSKVSGCQGYDNGVWEKLGIIRSSKLEAKGLVNGGCRSTIARKVCESARSEIGGRRLS